MKNLIAFLFTAFLLVWMNASVAYAQGGNGRGACMRPLGISYYKITPGHEDEWLTLYRRWHLPILMYGLEHGTLLEHKLYMASGHAMEPDYTFATSYLFPAAQERATAPLGRAELIEDLYGAEMDAYVAGEKRRWALTEKHWDTDFVELNLEAETLSVYLPSKGGCDRAD